METLNNGKILIAQAATEGIAVGTLSPFLVKKIIGPTVKETVEIHKKIRNGKLLQTNK